MPAPHLPTAFATPIVNPAIGSVGAPPIPYISISEFSFAPTGLGRLGLARTPSKNPQTLADTIRRASVWADTIVFGTDPSAQGVSLAASFTVQSGWVKANAGEIRLLCNYKPIIEVVGVTLGSGPAHLTPLVSTIRDTIVIQTRTITVPFNGAIYRSGDLPSWGPIGNIRGRVYAVWSYVNGYPHTKLLTNVAAGATSCKVSSTDGTGGLWGVYAATGAFLGSQLRVVDQANTENVFVTAVTKTSTSVTTLTTSPFRNAHTIPGDPDFIPVTAIPEDVHEAVISFTSMLIKLRGTIAQEMPASPTLTPSDRQVFAQAGALEDYEIGLRLIKRYRVVATKSLV